MAIAEAPVRPRTSLHSGPFATEPFYDFRNQENARRMRAAVAKVRSQLGREYDLIIGGQAHSHGRQDQVPGSLKTVADRRHSSEGW